MFVGGGIVVAGNLPVPQEPHEVRNLPRLPKEIKYYFVLKMVKLRENSKVDKLIKMVNFNTLSHVRVTLINSPFTTVKLLILWLSFLFQDQRGTDSSRIMKATLTIDLLIEKGCVRDEIKSLKDGQTSIFIIISCHIKKWHPNPKATY